MSPERPVWQQALSAFFDERGSAIGGRPSLDDLCFIAGRDPRVWRDEAVRNDLRDSILQLTGAGPDSSILEIGSAAGFLAMLVAPRVGSFEGVDLAEAPLAVARRLGLRNATFRHSDGAELPYADGTFDAAFCYDVFTNFPSIEAGRDLVSEMLRVVKRGGCVLVGNIPDAERRDDLPDRVVEVGRTLERLHGPLPPQPKLQTPPAPIPAPPLTLVERAFSVLGFSRRPERSTAQAQTVQPAIVTYDFERRSFADLARDLSAKVTLHEVHSLNPYHGYRFNAVFRRPAG